ncbi:hypothetical protein FQN57_004288 [Myotisia sp. PD_48]|nr:hypothetical protein FQN57_004288 [Myotisia sp. PD_48]
MTARIDTVLASRAPAITDENDWEEFTLTDVKVYIPGKSRYANLLTASPDKPVAVTGQLEPVEEDQESLVLDPDYRQKRILIENVTHSAYGQHDDGGVGIWAAGDAGWFSISPAKGYKPMFGQIVEAVDLLYFLADNHQRRPRRGKNSSPKLDYLLEEYTRHTNGACEDASDSAEIFNKHSEFLIKQMMQGKEGVDWASTSIYSHLQNKYPDLFEKLNHTSDEDHTTPHEEFANDSLANAEIGQTQAHSIFEMITEMKDSGFLSKRKLNINSLATELMNKYEIGSVEHALELIQKRAHSIIELMDGARDSTFDWTRKALYRQIKEAANSDTSQNVLATPLHPRATKAGVESSAESSKEEDVTSQKKRRRRNRKSILRPKMSSVSAKAAGKQNRNYARWSDSDEDRDEMLIDDTPTKRGGSHLIHKPLTTKSNENIRPILSDSDRSLRHDESMEESSEHSEPTGFDDVETQMNPVPPSSHFITNTAGTISGDIWTCSVPGCGKLISKAASKRSKEIINDHSLVHADDTQTKLDLVFAEHRLNVNTSVSHLLDRIRSGTAGKS